jgi:hypothetical protein
VFLSWLYYAWWNTFESGARMFHQGRHDNARENENSRFQWQTILSSSMIHTSLSILIDEQAQFLTMINWQTVIYFSSSVRTRAVRWISKEKSKQTNNEAVVHHMCHRWNMIDTFDISQNNLSFVLRFQRILLSTEIYLSVSNTTYRQRWQSMFVTRKN